MLLGGLCSLNAQTFDDFLSSLETTPDSLRQTRADSFYNARTQLPLIENDTLVTFIYRGTANTVALAGDANNWNPRQHPFTRIENTTLWYRRETYEADARLDYKLVINGDNWILDPRNPYTIRGGFGNNSELRMPQYQFPEETQFRFGIPNGSTRDTTFASEILGNSRRIRVYLPPGYGASQQFYPCMIVHDGPDYISLGNAINVLNNLIADGRIRPIIALFIPSVKRSAEYAGDLREEFAAFIVNDILEWARKRYRILDGPENMLTMGSSNGGNISLFLALTYPGVFGKIAAQSSNVEDYISTGYQQAEKRDQDFYLNLGTYDIPILLPRVRNFIPILEEKGYDFFYGEYHEGHSWGFWKAHIDDILIRFFPATDTGIKKSEILMPSDFLLEQNYPNPFNGNTIIRYHLDRSTDLTASIYDISGRKIKTLWQGLALAGDSRLTWDGTNDHGIDVASGTYIVTILIGGQLAGVRKMILLR